MKRRSHIGPRRSRLELQSGGEILNGLLVFTSSLVRDSGLNVSFDCFWLLRNSKGCKGEDAGYEP
jgi:hypothetical protein